MGRGYNGDCRDCSYYRDNFHRSIYQDGYKCDYSGEYFDDQYGEQCHCFCDLAEVRAAEERRRIKDEEFKAALYGYMLSDDDNEVVDDETKPRRQRIEDGNASGFSASATVSPMLISSIPANAMISPICASSVSTRFKPLYVYTYNYYLLMEARTEWNMKKLT